MSKKTDNDIFQPPFLYDIDIVKRWDNKITLKTLRNWRGQGKGPPYTIRTGRVMYPLAGIIQYENERNIIPGQNKKGAVC